MLKFCDSEDYCDLKLYNLTRTKITENIYFITSKLNKDSQNLTINRTKTGFIRQRNLEYYSSHLIVTVS